MSDKERPTIESLDAIVRQAMALFPCCICGKPSAYALKAKGDIVVRPYCDKCSINKKRGNQN